MWVMTFAGLLFLGTHLGISSTPVRDQWVQRLGERGYLIAYSLLAVLTLGYLIYLYGALPRHEYFWLPDPTLYLVPKIVMPVAAVLLVGGFMVRNPTAVGMAGTLQNMEPADLARGVIRITRHPFQWAVVLWAAAHIVANGDRVSVVFFGTLLVLGLAGGVLIDRKKARTSGADFTAFAAVTSNLPFAAIIGGRNRLVLKELIGPVLVGLVVYALMYWGHPWIAGVRVA